MIEEQKTLTVSEDLSKAITAATEPDAIRAAILAEAEKQGVTAETLAAAAAKQAADAKAAADAAASDAAPKGFSRTVNIAGRDFTFEEATELELERAINNAYTVAYAIKQDDAAQAAERTTVDPAVAAAEAAKAAEAQIAAKAELELQFKRGEITAADYIEKSGALTEYLEKQGVPLEALRASVEGHNEREFEMSWKDATEQFKNSPAGADWPGGELNLQLIGLKIQALNLVEAKDKVAALAQAYEDMKRTKMIFPGESAAVAATDTTDPAAVAAAVAAKQAADAKAAADAAAASKDPAALAVAAQRAAEIAAAAAAAAREAAKVAPTSSSMFGYGSGPADGAGTTEKKVAATVAIPKDASPQEILEAWKAGQVAAGKDPNAAFKETFGGRAR